MLSQRTLQKTQHIFWWDSPIPSKCRGSTCQYNDKWACDLSSPWAVFTPSWKIPSKFGTWMLEKILSTSLFPIHIASAQIYFQAVSLYVRAKDLCILKSPICIACEYKSMHCLWCGYMAAHCLSRCAWEDRVERPTTPQPASEHFLSPLAPSVIFRMTSGLVQNVQWEKEPKHSHLSLLWVCDQWCQ